MAVGTLHDNRRHVIGLQRSILTGSEMNLAGIEVIELCICLFQRLGFLTVLIPETMMQPDFKRVRAKCLARFLVHSFWGNYAMCSHLKRTLNPK